MAKIKVGRIVELEGDEMARVIWQAVREKLLLPYLDIDLITHDISLEERGKYGDSIVEKAVDDIIKHGVGVVCSKLNPTPAVLKEYNINTQLESPLKIIRHRLDCILIREPILCANIPKAVNSWKEPIIIIRHPQYDQYKATELSLPYAGTLELVFTAEDGNERRVKVKDMPSKGVAMAMINTEESIKNFAKLSFEYALERKLPLIFTTKHTMLNVYDGKFKAIFEETFKEYEDKFKENDITFKTRLTDEMMACVITSEGGFIWACKNYDGDVQSDIIAQGFGSAGMMTSIMKCPDRKTFVAEPFHGTLSTAYKEFKEGIPTSCNPLSIIYAWANALNHRAKLDCNCELHKFCNHLKDASRNVIEEGRITKDLAVQMHGAKNMPQSAFLETFEFIDLIKEELDRRMSGGK